MKVLWVGCYRDGTGYAQASIDYVLALDAAGVDVVCRPLKLNDARPELPPRILELEAKSGAACTHVVQHTLPTFFDYNGRFQKNVGLFASETTHFRSSGWADRVNTMDECWVINRQSAEAARASGVTVPVRVVPHASDVGRFGAEYETLDCLSPWKARGDFLFYTVGEMVRRKNLGALLRAFHTEFDPDEPVQLVVKTSRPGLGEAELRQQLTAYCVDVKRGLRLHGGDPAAFKEEIVVLGRLTSDEMMQLHATCDCFVSASHGEAWNLAGYDSMGMGRTPILPRFGGHVDYLSDREGWLVDCHVEPVFGVDDSVPDLYSGDEEWASVDILHLRSCMRRAFADSGLRKEKAEAGRLRALDFNYLTVGNIMKGALECPTGATNETSV